MHFDVSCVFVYFKYLLYSEDNLKLFLLNIFNVN